MREKKGKNNTSHMPKTVAAAPVILFERFEMRKRNTWEVVRFYELKWEPGKF